MSILEQTPGLLDALRGEMTPKFLATRSAAGVPNVVPCITLLPADDQPDLVFFGNFLLRKSIKNLKEDPRVAILVITPDLRGWMLTGDFVEFQRTGPYVDRQMSSSLLRYNAYTGIRDAGLIRVRAVEGMFAISKLQVLRDYLLARIAALGRGNSAKGGTTIPLAVRREFAKMAAVKVLTWLRADGYPRIVPALSLQPAGTQALTCWQGMRLPEPPPGAQVATNILTFEAISYQAKGLWTTPIHFYQGLWSARGHTGVIRVAEVYAGGPPLPGGRVA